MPNGKLKVKFQKMLYSITEILLKDAIFCDGRTVTMTFQLCKP